MTSSLTNGMVAALGAMIMLMGIFGVGPLIETRWFPVYSKMKVVSVERIPPNRSLVTAEYTKIRDCPPIGSAWYNSPVSREIETTRQLEFVPRRAVGAVKPINRPIGKHTSVPFELDASPEELTSTVFAEVFSRCHPFWTTRTLIYP